MLLGLQFDRHFKEGSQQFLSCVNKPHHPKEEHESKLKSPICLAALISYFLITLVSDNSQLRSLKPWRICINFSRLFQFKHGQSWGLFQPVVEFCDGQAQPGRLQHCVSGGPANLAPPGHPHHLHRVLPLLLLSPCRRMLLLLPGLHGNSKVRDKKEEKFVQRRRPVDLGQTRGNDGGQGRTGNGVKIVDFLGNYNRFRKYSHSSIYPYVIMLKSDIENMLSKYVQIHIYIINNDRTADVNFYVWSKTAPLIEGNGLAFKGSE